MHGTTETVAAHPIKFNYLSMLVTEVNTCPQPVPVFWSRFKRTENTIPLADTPFKTVSYPQGPPTCQPWNQAFTLQNLLYTATGNNSILDQRQLIMIKTPNKLPHKYVTLARYVIVVGTIHYYSVNIPDRATCKKLGTRASPRKLTLSSLDLVGRLC